MSYSAWSVVTGEQPSAAKWNLLGANDAFFSLYATADGWSDASEAWAYASATTITIPAGGTNKYAVGDRIKLTQSATVKYFVVTAVASTVLTITGGTDYTLANAAISANYYSHAASPVGYPGWFAYTPVLTGFSASPTGLSSSSFAVNGRICIAHPVDGGNGTSNTTAKTWTLPILCATNNSYQVNNWVLDNNVQTHGIHISHNPASAGTVDVYPGPAGGTTWTASGNCRLFDSGMELVYQI